LENESVCNSVRVYLLLSRMVVSLCTNL
jgi:hypothetical protein